MQKKNKQSKTNEAKKKHKTKMMKENDFEN